MRWVVTTCFILRNRPSKYCKLQQYTAVYSVTYLNWETWRKRPLMTPGNWWYNSIKTDLGKCIMVCAGYVVQYGIWRRSYERGSEQILCKHNHKRHGLVCLCTSHSNCLQIVKSPHFGQTDRSISMYMKVPVHKNVYDRDYNVVKILSEICYKEIRNVLCSYSG